MGEPHVFQPDLNADACEFCPSGPRKGMLVLGTYQVGRHATQPPHAPLTFLQLEEGTDGGKAEQQTRHGALYVLSATADGERVSLDLESSREVPGVVSNYI